MTGTRAADDHAALLAVMRAVHNHHRWIGGLDGPYVRVADIDDAYHAALSNQDGRERPHDPCPSGCGKVWRPQATDARPCDHDWRWDCDNPILKCAKCGAMQDALTGKPWPPKPQATGTRLEERVAREIFGDGPLQPVMLEEARAIIKIVQQAG